MPVPKTNTRQVANKKQRDTAAADAEMKARRAAEAGETVGNNKDEKTGPADLLAAGDDEDVIF